MSGLPGNGQAPRIVTIGVYGFDEPGFFAALTKAGVDTFCDIRRRRGLRGSEYAFANSKRLQERLAQLGIRYLHFQSLAPSQAVRDLQHQDDEQRGIGKRSRGELSPAFVRAYSTECLDGLDVSRFLDALGPDARVVALFCVEREPAACHRSLVASKLAAELRVVPEHLRP